jgi:hypothetical protein
VPAASGLRRPRLLSIVRYSWCLVGQPSNSMSVWHQNYRYQPESDAVDQTDDGALHDIAEAGANGHRTCHVHREGEDCGPEGTDGPESPGRHHQAAAERDEERAEEKSLR